MKLLIFDDNRISSFDLPETTEPYFVVNYESLDSKINEIITLYSDNGKWTIKADYNVSLSSYGEKYEVAVLEEYRIFNIHFEMVNKDIRFVMIPSYEVYTDISLNEITQILIGCGMSCHIKLSDHGLLVINAEILKKEDGYYIHHAENTSEPIYVNGKTINIEKKINFGDRIFINGIKIIWLNNYFKINNPSGKLEVQGLKLASIDKQDINNYKPTSETEHNLKLYDYKDLFFHSPIIKDSIEEHVINIDQPPAKSTFESIPIILTMGPTTIIGLSTVLSALPSIQSIVHGEANFETWLSFIFCILMIIVCVFFPIFTDRYQKNKVNKKEADRIKKYGGYLDEKEAEINEIVKEQTDILNAKHLTLEEVTKQIQCKGHFLWSREITEEDFMLVRVGIGNQPAKIKINCSAERFTIDDDELSTRLYDIANKEYTLVNVPASVNIAKNLVSPFIINIPEREQFIKSIILQLMFYYSSKDVKLIILTNEERKKYWNDIKYSSHCWSDDKKTRFFATNENEIAQISMYLETILSDRVKDGKQGADTNGETEYPYRRYDQYYLIVTDDYHLAKDANIIGKLLNGDVNYGISLLVFAETLKDLPSRLKEFTVVEKGNSGIYYRKMGRLVKKPFSVEHLLSSDISKYAEIIGNIPIGSKDTQEMLPSSISFLEMYGAGKVEHLNILSRWSLNDPTISLNAPMGYQSNVKQIGLDLHEKAHGPHGLIAGSTGSGKSEFIISYILSMAVNYHPYEVQFVLIDYKGGGLAGAFEKREKGIRIPHLVGTITNLDKGEMHRTLVSIKSELERRQIEFNKARDLLNESTIDIYKYQRLYREGKVQKPIAHLFIVSDEFAELKQQQPEFMEELISTARIGRSLGVHLILATQKPSGVVNDQIWSNSRFKVCLKVQNAEDSLEVIRKDDASKLKETGRFILQVGNDELFLTGQSAWAGEKYVPTDHLLSKVNDSIDFIGNDGTIVKSVNDAIKNDPSKQMGDQLTNVVQYLYDVGLREKINFSSLWLPSIPGEIMLIDTIKKYNYQATKYNIDAVIGEYDRPTKQEQGLLTIDITNDNTIIIGNPGSGKENLLSTIIFSASILHTPQEVNFYILDFGAETLNVFNKMPHVGEVITAGDINKLDSFFNFIDREIKHRKDIMSEYGGLYSNYIRKSPTKLPTIVVILNNVENFAETGADYDNHIQRFLREGIKYGISFIFTVNSTTALRTTLMELFERKILLQLTEPYDYRYMLGAPAGMVPSNFFGRGIIKYDDEACEFQTAYIAQPDVINDIVRENATRFSEYYKTRASAIKIMPKEVSFKKMTKYTKYLNAIPIGYDNDTIDIFYYNFVKPNNHLIIGKSVTDDIEFLAAIIDLIGTLKGLKIKIFDFISCIEVEDDMEYHNQDFDKPLQEVLDYNGEEFVVNFFLGVGNVSEALGMLEINTLTKITNNIENFKNQYFVFIDNYNRVQNVSDFNWFNSINNKTGIWVGEYVDNQSIFQLEEDIEIPEDDSLQDRIYIISDGKIKLAKGVKEDV